MTPSGCPGARRYVSWLSSEPGSRLALARLEAPRMVPYPPWASQLASGRQSVNDAPSCKRCAAQRSGAPCHEPGAWVDRPWTPVGGESSPRLAAYSRGTVRIRRLHQRNRGLEPRNGTISGSWCRGPARMCACVGAGRGASTGIRAPVGCNRSKARAEITGCTIHRSRDRTRPVMGHRRGGGDRSRWGSDR